VLDVPAGNGGATPEYVEIGVTRPEGREPAAYADLGCLKSASGMIPWSPSS